MTSLHCLHLCPKLLSNVPVCTCEPFPSLFGALQGAVHDHGKTFAVLCQHRQCSVSLEAAEASLPASTAFAPGPGVCAELLPRLSGTAGGRGERDSELLRSLALSLCHHLQQHCFPNVYLMCPYRHHRQNVLVSCLVPVSSDSHVPGSWTVKKVASHSPATEHTKEASSSRLPPWSWLCLFPALIPHSQI